MKKEEKELNQCFRIALEPWSRREKNQIHEIAIPHFTYISGPAYTCVCGWHVLCLAIAFNGYG